MYFLHPSLLLLYHFFLILSSVNFMHWPDEDQATTVET